MVEIQQEQIDINKGYFEALKVRRTNLLEQARETPNREELAKTFERIIAINRIQMGLIPQMYPEIYRKVFERR